MARRGKGRSRARAAALPAARSPQPRRLSLEDPAPLLRWLGNEGPRELDLDSLEVAEIWGLVALGTLARQTRAPAVRLKLGTSNTGRFAFAVGIEELIRGLPRTGPGEPGRTVKLSRLSRLDEIEPAAEQISRLLVQSTKLEDTRRVLYYVLVELLRNALQHSQDPLGGVVAAQLNDRGRNLDRPVIQVAVADAGIGIPRSLRSTYPRLTDSEEALDKALWPHVSGTFEEGLTGNQQNAGMGLFFIAEMAKLSAGYLVIASRGATLLLSGDAQGEERHSLRFLAPKGTGFPGTLVAFEIPVGEIKDFAALLETIKERARQRTPVRQVHRWFVFGKEPAGVQKVLVKVALEDTMKAAEFAEKTLKPRLMQRGTMALDFQGISVCTQSFLHALLFEPLRLAWALRVKIHVVNAEPAVRSNLELLENYALGG